MGIRKTKKILKKETLETRKTLIMIKKMFPKMEEREKTLRNLLNPAVKMRNSFLKKEATEIKKILRKEVLQKKKILKNEIMETKKILKKETPVETKKMRKRKKILKKETMETK